MKTLCLFSAAALILASAAALTGCGEAETLASSEVAAMPRRLAAKRADTPPDFVPEFAGKASAPARLGQPRQGANSGGGRGDAAGHLDALMAWERADHGVPPSRGLRDGEPHGPTPNQLPGGQVIATKGLLPLLEQGIPVYVFDVLGVRQSLPGAIPLAWAAQSGDFDDEVQARLDGFLRQVTRGDRAAPLVLYCGGPQCWLSYNAALRAVHLGYRNVLWYRGGMEAWARAGQRFERAQS